MLTAETLGTTVWLCFWGSWGQWSSYPSFPQLVEMGGLDQFGEGNVFPQENWRAWLRWDTAGECACKGSQRRERLLIL